MSLLVGVYRRRLPPPPVATRTEALSLYTTSTIHNVSVSSSTLSRRTNVNHYYSYLSRLFLSPSSSASRVQISNRGYKQENSLQHSPFSSLCSPLSYVNTIAALEECCVPCINCVYKKPTVNFFFQTTLSHTPNFALTLGNDCPTSFCDDTFP